MQIDIQCCFSTLFLSTLFNEEKNCVLMYTFICCHAMKLSSLSSISSKITDICVKKYTVLIKPEFTSEICSKTNQNAIILWHRTIHFGSDRRTMLILGSTYRVYVEVVVHITGLQCMSHFF